MRKGDVAPLAATRPPFLETLCMRADDVAPLAATLPSFLEALCRRSDDVAPPPVASWRHRRSRRLEGERGDEASSLTPTSGRRRQRQRQRPRPRRRPRRRPRPSGARLCRPGGPSRELRQPPVEWRRPSLRPAARRRRGPLSPAWLTRPEGDLPGVKGLPRGSRGQLGSTRTAGRRDVRAASLRRWDLVRHERTLARGTRLGPRSTPTERSRINDLCQGRRPAAEAVNAAARTPL